jgi:hypothetical protein
MPSFQDPGYLDVRTIAGSEVGHVTKFVGRSPPRLRAEKGDRFDDKKIYLWYKLR